MSLTKQPGHSREKNNGKHPVYKNVYHILVNGTQEGFYRATVRRDKKQITVSNNDPKAAALALDKLLIRRGYEPINVLKRK